jgi:hypothetical protein
VPPGQDPVTTSNVRILPRKIVGQKRTIDTSHTKSEHKNSNSPIRVALQAHPVSSTLNLSGMTDDRSNDIHKAQQGRDLHDTPLRILWWTP